MRRWCPLIADVIRQSEMAALVRRSELLGAFEWVSAAGPFENAAYVCRRTGKIWLVSDFDDMGEEAPADVDDESLYVAVPGKKELDLGRSLALRFADEHLPDRSLEIRSYFRGPGAYAQFKRVLDATDMLEAWYAFESNGIDQALRAWAAENNIELSE